ncbi:MAG: hypothetical protein A3G91_06335 [Omnitrophica WOR_2 bacterium RIFCSPLOWO2_12_FULL_50_9]|nr:MAG: hypothetical protein A3D87_07595 [Omnitrophica WOR_2 bacterium RIFCSPHIGHO2_02_FULL_50_17]OGX41374.1 MAG: hypothetical protein A3G91_06335 [Omnitrophica WOR_2 bacterium RIFCSPLOWO2_12_FULL_50_9]
MSHTVYVLEDRYDRIYIGQTKNLASRLKDHKLGRTKSLRNRGPFHIIYTETLESRIKAVQRERALKSGQGRTWLRSNIKRTGL